MKFLYENLLWSVSLVILSLVILVLTDCTFHSQRVFKNFSSRVHGLKRVCHVYAKNGRLLKSYAGTFNVEEFGSYHLYFDLDGKRVIVSGATVICDEIAHE